jgi:hypothetical protein
LVGHSFFGKGIPRCLATCFAVKWRKIRKAPTSATNDSAFCFDSRGVVELHAQAGTF